MYACLTFHNIAGSHTVNVLETFVEAATLKHPGTGTPQVAKLRAQVEEQETSLKAQEEEVMSKRQELTDLKNQENQLEESVARMKKRIDELSITQQETQLHISQVNSNVNFINKPCPCHSAFTNKMLPLLTSTSHMQLQLDYLWTGQ